jgi:hypothetical protein
MGPPKATHTPSPARLRLRLEACAPKRWPPKRSRRGLGRFLRETVTEPRILRPERAHPDSASPTHRPKAATRQEVAPHRPKTVELSRRRLPKRRFDPSLEVRGVLRHAQAETSAQPRAPRMPSSVRRGKRLGYPTSADPRGTRRARTRGTGFHRKLPAANTCSTTRPAVTTARSRPPLAWAPTACAAGGRAPSE